MVYLFRRFIDYIASYADFTKCILLFDTEGVLIKRTVKFKRKLLPCLYDVILGRFCLSTSQPTPERSIMFMLPTPTADAVRFAASCSAQNPKQTGMTHQ